MPDSHPNSALENLDGSLLGRATARGALWRSLSGLTSSAVAFAATMVITYYVGREDYGRASAALTVVTTIGFLSVPGLAPELIRRRDRFAEAATLAVVLSSLTYCILAGLTLVWAPVVAGAFNVPEAATYLRWALVIPLPVILFLISQVLLARQLRFGVLGGIEIASTLGGAGTAVALAFAGWGGMAVVVGQAVQAVVHGVAGTALTNLTWIRRPRLDWRLLRRMLAFGIPIQLSRILEWGSSHWDNLFVATLFGPRALGAYAVAYNVAYLPAYTIVERSSGVLFATLARIATDPRRRRRLMPRSLGALAMLLAPIPLLTSLCGPQTMHLLLPEEWARAIAPLLTALGVMAFGLPLQLVSKVYLEVIGRPRVATGIMAVRAFLLFALLSVFGRDTLSEAAWAVSAAFVASGVAACALAIWVDGISVKTMAAELVPVAVGGLLAAGSVLASRAIHSPSAPVLQLIVEVHLVVLTYGSYQLMAHRGRLAWAAAALRGRTPAKSRNSRMSK